MNWYMVELSSSADLGEKDILKFIGKST
jgi:hypothetical protein